MTILLLAVVGTCLPLLGQQYTITTIAGDGAAGVSLSNPTSVAVDPAGNVYVGDWTGLIRKIWAGYRTATIVAGTGVLGYSGDGGQATSAMIGRSISITLDPAGNLYIADADNNRIRRVDGATGIITTLATGASQSTGISLDLAGNLYFSAFFTRVQKLNAGTGTTETIAGGFLTSFSGDGGSAINALFWDPVPTAIGRNGDIYIADFENSRVRMVSASTGIVTTIAGSGGCVPGPPPLGVLVCQSGFAGDGGPAASAILNYPSAVALDAEGNLYIADTINHRIRRVDGSTGIIYTIAGNGTSGFRGDGGPALAAEITFPSSIAVDSSGKVYFADENNNRIRMLAPVVAPHNRRGQGPER